MTSISWSHRTTHFGHSSWSHHACYHILQVTLPHWTINSPMGEGRIWAYEVLLPFAHGRHILVWKFFPNRWGNLVREEWFQMCVSKLKDICWTSRVTRLNNCPVLYQHGLEPEPDVSSLDFWVSCPFTMKKKGISSKGPLLGNEEYTNTPNSFHFLEVKVEFICFEYNRKMPWNI